MTLDADLMLRQITKQLFFQGNEPPPLLYHYTDHEGLLGILSTGRIWASDPRCLNDRTELVHAVDMVERWFDHKKSKVAFGPWVEWWMRRMRDFFQVGAPMFFVSCLSEESDDVAQWRGYGQRGNGYALGFESKELHLAQGAPIVAGIGQVIYTEAQKLELLDKTLAPVLDALASEFEQLKDPSHDGSRPGPDEEAFEKLFTRVVPAAVAFLSWKMKHKTFKSEAEWRMVAAATSVKNPGSGSASLEDIKFRGGDRIVPFVELHLGKPHPLREIRLGPKQRDDEYSVRLMLKKHGFSEDDVKVLHSEAPYR